MSSYLTTFQPLAFMKGVAALTILSMILSAFPASFLIAEAEEVVPPVETPQMLPTEEVTTPVDEVPAIEPVPVTEELPLEPEVLMAPTVLEITPVEVSEVPPPVKKPNPFVGCVSDVNLVTNGSFEAPSLAESSFGWDVFPTGASGLSWLISWLTDDESSPNPALLEIQNSTIAHTAYDGTQYAELDSNWNPAPGGPYFGEDARVRIEQSIPTTPGATYRIAYAFSALPGTGADNNQLEVLVNGVSVDTHTKNGTSNTDTDWTVYTQEFVATGASTVIAFKDNGKSDTFGTLIDDIGAVKCAEPVEPPPSCTLTILSDTNTIVKDTDEYAVTTYNGNQAWTASIPGAVWVWDTSQVVDANVDTTRTFVETFVVTDPKNARLDIAADNGYQVYLNGVLVRDEIATEDNFRSTTQDTIPLTLVSGQNTLEITVKNFAQPGGNYESNPAGLLFKMYAEGSTRCDRTTEIVVEEPTYQISGYKWNDLNGNGIWEEEEPTLSGWTIEATDGEEVLSDVTDEEGYYSIRVPHGEWTVREVLQTGWTQTGLRENFETMSETRVCEFMTGYKVSARTSESEMFYEGEYEGEYRGYRCDFGNQQDVIETPENDRPTARTGTRVSGGNRPAGQVLGATTQCGLWLEDYMQKATVNDTFQVLKLQVFLNFNGFTTPITGVFDDATEAQVKLFQAKYADEIIKPWFERGIVSHNRPTGFVYKTTRWKINNIVCPGSEPYPSFEGENLEENVVIR